MLRAIDKWLPGYVAGAIRRMLRGHRPSGLRHIFFCVADHFEPFVGGAGRAEALERVDAWVREYPARFSRFRDADGRPPRHTFFFPQDQYDGACLDRLRPLVEQGYGEVEVHLHHRDDTPDGLAEKLAGFRDVLHRRHGYLGTDSGRQPRYGFIHGNWALCNSRPDGDWCGVSEELAVLAATGCYADFTFPSAPSPTQPRLVNTIYHARDRVGSPRGADSGRPVRVGGSCEPGELMIIPGPLALNWRRRKWGLLPRLENSELSGVNPPGPERLGLWVRQQIHVAGRGDWVFVKVHTHGCVAANRAVLLGAAMEAAHAELGRRFNDGRRWCLHYVTARELYNLIRAAESSASAEPYAALGFEIAPPPAA